MAKTSEPVLQEALERFKESQDGTDFNRQAAYEDIEFARLGKQWPDKVEQTRKEENRPCLTINKLPAFIRQVVNDARQNKPGVNIHPVDNGADKNTAEVIAGLVRSIERRSNAEVAYDTAIDHSVSGGFGFFRIGIDFCHDETFKMECRIHRVPNPLMVHWDPNSTAFDASDWDYGFVSDFLTEDQFETRYPKAAKVSFEGDYKDQATYWLEDDKIRVAEYWERIEKKRTLLLLSNGGVVREDLFKDDVKAMADVNGVTVRKTRDVTFYEVRRRVISGVEVLEGDGDDGLWPGSMIPICPVWGEEVIHNGRRYFRSMIQDAKDPQRMFNYWRSASTELVALAPRAPFIGAQGFVPEGQEEKWETANTRSHAYLEYVLQNGAPGPTRQPFAGVPAGALQESLNASDDMKAIIGIYDPSLGARSNETSGKAILARQKESDISNFHFVDNLNRAIAYAGKVLVEIIPHVYSEQETVRILGEDMKEQIIQLTSQGEQAFQPGSQPEDGGEEQKPLYDFTVGKYDVTVESGPSYSTAREETRETLVQIMAQVPGSAALLGDVLMEHMDFQGADKVAERLKLMLPPQIQAAEGIKAPPAAQAQANPLVSEKLKAEIESLRAGAIANLTKAGVAQQSVQLDALESVMNALNMNQPTAPGGVPGMPGVVPQTPPAQGAQPSGAQTAQPASPPQGVPSPP